MNAVDLIDALKGASGPDRELDDHIWRWANEHKLNPTAPGWQYDLRDAPAYTASLDAAVLLLPVIGTHPEEPDYRADFVLEHTNGGMTIGARVGHNDPDRTAWGANDAIALAQGALQLHAEMGCR